MTPARPLAIVLLAIALLYAAWFAQDKYRVAALLVFAVPPLVLALLAWRGWPRVAFVAGLFALAWFSHAVMVAWTRPDERLPSALAIVLSVAVILLPGLSRLRNRKRT
jgi:uncharacterized membrane protein